jgi:hypothetical protein
MFSRKVLFLIIRGKAVKDVFLHYFLNVLTDKFVKIGAYI